MAKPKLRFPEFTDEWEEKILKDFMFFKNGLNADKDKFGSGIKYISVMDILNNPFITYDVIRGKVDVDDKTLDNYSVTYGDVLFQRSSETREDAGKSNVYLDKENTATFGGFVIRGKKTGNYSPEFMNSLLKSQRVRKEITSKAQGAQHINVGQETLENVSVTLPTIKEQQKIADFLSSVDDVIQVQEKELSALEEQKKGVMQKLFNREVRFKADDGSEYPEWEEKRLGDAVETVTDYVAAGSFADLAKNVIYNNFKDYAQLIRTTDLKSDFLRNDFVYVSESAFRYLYRVNLDKESIIMPNVGNCGEIYYIIPKKLPYKNNVLGPNAILLRSSSVNNKFLSYLFVQKDFQVKLKIITSPSGQTKFNKTDLKNIRFYIPCADEQQNIADCLSAYDEAIQIKKDKLEVWKEIKKGLLQQMFV